MVQSVCPNQNTPPLILQGAESSWIHTAADADISMYHRPFALSSHWRAKYNYLEIECSILWFLKHTPSSLILWKSLLPGRLPFLIGIHLIKVSWQLYKSSLTTRFGNIIASNFVLYMHKQWQCCTDHLRPTYLSNLVLILCRGVIEYI